MDFLDNLSKKIIEYTNLIGQQEQRDIYKSAMYGIKMHNI